MKAYLRVLRAPGVLLPTVGTALASVPIGMLGLAFLLLVRQRTGSVAAAGAMVAVFGIGTVAGMFVQGRLLDRFGPRRVLLVASVLRAATSVAVVVSPPWASAVLVLVVGASEPQVGGALRALWPMLVAPALRPVATALSSVLFELPVLAGPLLLAAVVAVFPVEVAIVVAAGFAVVGSWMFACSTAVGRWRRPAAPPSGPIVAPGARVIVAVMVVQGLLIGLLQVTMAAATSGTGAGTLYALLTAGSLLGTLTYGAWPVTARLLVPGLLGGLAVVLGIAGLTGIPAVCVFGFGLLVGPLGVRCFLDLGAAAHTESPAAAVTLLIAAGLTATSLGSALAGWAVEAGGPALPVAIGAGAAGLTAVAMFMRPVADHPAGKRPRGRP